VRESIANGEETYMDCANISLYTKGMLVVLVLIVFCALWYVIYNCFPYSAVARYCLSVAVHCVCVIQY
jgi:hypothetical protein